MSDFVGKTVLLTGAAKGIGRGTAIAFADQGADLVLVDLDEDGVGVVVDELRSSGTRVVTHAVDVTSSESVATMVRDVTATVERVDALVNVAGIYPGDRLVDMTDDLWRSVIEVNLTGTFFVCRELARHMLDHGGGSIVNISSVRR